MYFEGEGDDREGHPGLQNDTKPLKLKGGKDKGIVSAYCKTHRFG